MKAIEQPKRNLPVFMPEEKECWLAMEGLPVRKLEPAKVETELLELIFLTFSDCRQTIDPKDAVLMAKRLNLDIQNYFSSLTMSEIKIAFKKGLLGEYGEWKWLSELEMAKWCKNYMGSTTRKETKAKMKKSEEVELTPEQKEQLILTGVHKCWDDFKEKGVIYDFGNSTYNYLDGKGLIPFTKERKWKIYKQVKERLIQQAKEKRVKVKDVFDKKNMDELIYALTSETGNEKNNLIFESRREALKIYFSDLLEMGEDLKELIKNK
jgi:hypothetical protein